MENRITITRDLFFEGLLTASRDSVRKVTGKSILALIVIWAGLLLFTIITKGSILTAFVQLGLVGAICLIMVVLLPRSNAKRVWKAMEAKYGSTPQRITTFFSDHLEIRGDCVEMSVPYTQIHQIKQSARMLILVCEDKTGILLDLEGFTGITADEVKNLIENANNA